MELTQAPWFEANPQLLQHELDALAALNIEPTIDSELQRQGILQIGLVIDPANLAFNLPAGIEPVQLSVTFPHSYPYFRPEVYGLNVTLPRHQNPIEKNLCLLPRATKHWNVEWTLAEFLQDQLSKVLKKGAITDEAVIAADPTEQAEPANNYYGGARAAAIFDSDAFDAIGTDDSDLTVLGRIKVGFSNKVIPARMAVLESATLKQQVIGQLPTVFKELFPVECEGYALRLSERPPYEDVHENVKWVKTLLAERNNGIVPQTKPVAGFKETSTKGSAVINNIWALNFPEEVGPGKMGMGWLFLVNTSVEITKMSGKKPVKERGAFAYFARAVRSGPKDTQIRVPHLTHLPKCTVAIVGLGALGGPAAIEFARNQIGALNLLDFDQVDPATTVRWPLGAPTFGQQKTDALLEFLNEQYPRTTVRVIDHKIGKTPGVGDPITEAQALHELFEGASLLFDASAETGVNHFLSQEARRRSIPYISLYTTPGAWGGLIMRVVPSKTEGCWMCLQHAKDKTIPVPKSDAAGEVQAPGCGDLTFTGASFDLQNVSLAAVRLAVSTLCADIAGGYPDVSWDVGVVSLVDDNNLPIPPSWQTFPLKADPQCPYCSAS